MSFNQAAIFILAALFIAGSICGRLVPEDNKFNFNILHISDLHSQFAGTGPDIETVRGHYARLKYMIDNLQVANDPKITLTVDAGDWFSGTLFHLISISKFYNELGAIELKFLADCKFDATTLGNHEFDPTESGLFHLLNKTQNKLINKLPIVVSNIHYVGEECDIFKSVSEPADNTFSPPTSSLDASENQSPTIVPYVLKELVDSRGKVLKVGIMGTLGIDANKVSAAYRSCLKFDGNDYEGSTSFNDYVKTIYKTSSMLRSDHGVQVIVLLAHGGEPEDNQVMEALENMNTNQHPIVDVHISSHTHHVYMVNKQIKSGANYVIHQAGPYAENLGILQFEYDLEKRYITRLLNKDIKEPTGEYFYSPDWFVDTTLFPIRIPITNTLPMDPIYKELIATYRSYIDQSFLSKVPYKYSTPVGHMPTRFANNLELTTFVNDCTLQQINKQIEPPFDLYMMAVAGIRVETPALQQMNASGEFVQFQFSDAYRMVGIGYLSPDVSADNLPGDTVAHFYMSKFEIYILINIANLIDEWSTIKDQYTLSVSSSVTYKMNKWGIPFVNHPWIGRIYDFKIHGIAYQDLPNYIHIGVPGWLTRFFDRAGDFTFGLLSMPYRDQLGHKMKKGAMRSQLNDYILFAQCLSEHGERGLDEMVEMAKESVNELPSWSELTEGANTEEAIAAGASVANPDHL